MLIKTYCFSLQDAIDLLGDFPDVIELQRLVENYPTYEKAHRMGLLKGFFEGKSVTHLVQDKRQALNKTPRGSARSAGGDARWVSKKARKTVVRILYLRYRIDEHMTRIQANRALLKNLPYETNSKDAGQSNIRKMTLSPVLDKAENSA